MTNNNALENQPSLSSVTREENTNGLLRATEMEKKALSELEKSKKTLADNIQTLQKSIDLFIKERAEKGADENLLRSAYMAWVEALKDGKQGTEYLDRIKQLDQPLYDKIETYMGGVSLYRKWVREAKDEYDDASRALNRAKLEQGLLDTSEALRSSQALGDVVDTYFDTNPYLSEHVQDYHTLVDGIRMALARKYAATYEKGGTSRDDALRASSKELQGILGNAYGVFLKNLDKKKEAEEMVYALEQGLAKITTQQAPNKGEISKNIANSADSLLTSATEHIVQALDKDIHGTQATQGSKLYELYQSISSGSLPDITSEIYESELQQRHSVLQKTSSETLKNADLYLESMQNYVSVDYDKVFEHFLRQNNDSTGDLTGLASFLQQRGMEDAQLDQMMNSLQGKYSPEKYQNVPKRALAVLAVVSSALASITLVNSLPTAFQAGKGLFTLVGGALGLTLGDITLGTTEIIKKADKKDILMVIKLGDLAKKYREATDENTKKALEKQMTSMLQVTQYMSLRSQLDEYERNKDKPKDVFMQLLKSFGENDEAWRRDKERQMRELVARDPELFHSVERYATLLDQLNKEMDPEKRKTLNTEASELEDFFIQRGLAGLISPEILARRARRYDVERHGEEFQATMQSLPQLLSHSSLEELQENIPQRLDASIFAQRAEQSLSEGEGLMRKYIDPKFVLPPSIRVDEEGRMEYVRTMMGDMKQKAEAFYDKSQVEEYYKELEQGLSQHADLQQRYETISRGEVTSDDRQWLLDRVNQYQSSENYQNLVSTLNPIKTDAIDAIRSRLQETFLRGNKEEVRRGILDFVAILDGGQRGESAEAYVKMLQAMQFNFEFGELEKTTDHILKIHNDLSKEQQVIDRFVESIKGNNEALGQFGEMNAMLRNVTRSLDITSDQMNQFYSARYQEIIKDRFDAYATAAKVFVEKYDLSKLSQKNMNAVYGAMGKDFAILQQRAHELDQAVVRSRNVRGDKALEDGYDNFSILVRMNRNPVEQLSGAEQKEQPGKLEAMQAYYTVMRDLNRHVRELQGMSSVDVKDGEYLTNKMLKDLSHGAVYSLDTFRLPNDKEDVASYQRMTQEAQLLRDLIVDIKSEGKTLSAATITRAMQREGITYPPASGPRQQSWLPLVSKENVRSFYSKIAKKYPLISLERTAGVVNALHLIEPAKTAFGPYRDILETTLRRSRVYKESLRVNSTELQKESALVGAMLLGNADKARLFMNMKPLTEIPQADLITLPVANLDMVYNMGVKSTGSLKRVPLPKDAFTSETYVELYGQRLRLNVLLKRGCGNVQIHPRELVSFIDNVTREVLVNPKYGAKMLPRIPSIEQLERDVDRMSIQDRITYLGREKLSVLPAWIWPLLGAATDMTWDYLHRPGETKVPVGDKGRSTPPTGELPPSTETPPSEPTPPTTTVEVGDKGLGGESTSNIAAGGTRSRPTLD